ncbi:hypothetical protein G6011_10969 [Alternaria panax]|uniref:Uncharacterized protein n=1 Tax=Alternaria panax TaxID=48097 RepID=A0AAD4NST7_9PLEO|nr:hypothetical protein G6011_10969 [Alternaria panax]
MSKPYIEHEEPVQDGLSRTLKDLFAGAVGGVAQNPKAVSDSGARQYKEQYEKAREMFEDGNPDESVAEAKKNLTQVPYSTISYLSQPLTKTNDTNSLEVLKDLREELDKVAEFQKKDTHDWLEAEGIMDVAVEADVDLTGGGHEEDDDEMDDVFEDAAAVAEAEEAILSLPMRPAPAIPELNVSPPLWPVPGISAPSMSITSAATTTGLTSAIAMGTSSAAAAMDTSSALGLPTACTIPEQKHAHASTKYLGKAQGKALRSSTLGTEWVHEDSKDNNGENGKT